MSFDNPRTPVLCLILTGGDHAAAMLLHRVFELQRFAKAEIPNVSGKWIAHSRQWWSREIQTSIRKIDRVFSKLKQRGLIETCPWWWKNKRILFCRTTALTNAYLQYGEHTWEDAAAMIECAQKGTLRLTKIGKAKLPDLATL